MRSGYPRSGAAMSRGWSGFATVVVSVAVGAGPLFLVNSIGE
jgi:hypothetical protein